MRRGLFLAILAVAARELQALGRVLDCDSELQGCDVDEGSDEPKGLDLLQTQITLQSDPAQTVPAAAGADGQLGPTKLQVVAKAVDSRDEVETAASQSLNEGVHLQAVLGSASARLFGIGVVIPIVILCVCFVHFRRSSQQCSEEVGQKPSSQESPAAQQRLSTGPRTKLLNARMASPVSSYTSPFASPTPSGHGLTILPPIYPALIMPNVEARCTIRLESLMTRIGKLDTQIQQFDILGTSGRKLLNGTVSETPEGRRCLALTSCGCDEDPCVTLLTPARQSQTRGMPRGVSGIMELYGKNGKFYGTLEPASRAGALLRCDGELVMSMEIGDSDLRMSAASMDGRVLAFAGKNLAQGDSMQHESKDMWTLQVKPNFDVVLIAACMLGVLIFK